MVQIFAGDYYIMIAINAQKISFSYDEKCILNNIDLYVNEGECVALTGGSGCGKSTLCYIIAGIIPRNIDGDLQGKVEIFGNDLSKLTTAQLSENLGIVFQNPDSQLFSPTVEDEIAFGPENLCLPVNEIDKRITEALKAVGMSEYRYANPFNLSGGQKQLIALAAVLSLKPKILVFDEALSQLDDESTKLIKNVVKSLKSSGVSILFVEHDEENLDIADRIYRLENGKINEVKNG